MRHTDKERFFRIIHDFQNIEQIEIAGILNKWIEELVHSERIMNFDPSEILNELRDKIYKEPRDENPNLSVGGPMNLYPSDQKGGCHQFCLAIASLDFDDKRKNNRETGFNGLMIGDGLISYWLGCSENRRTLILVSDWDDKKFEKTWQPIIDSACSRGRKVFIVEVTRTGFHKRYSC